MNHHVNSSVVTPERTGYKNWDNLTGFGITAGAAYSL